VGSQGSKALECIYPPSISPHLLPSVTWHIQVFTSGFSSIRVKYRHYNLASVTIWCWKGYSMRLQWGNRRYTAFHPAAPRPICVWVIWHIQVVYLQFLLDPGEIQALQPCKCSNMVLKRRNTGTTTLQVLQYGVGKGILCAYSKEIDVKLLFTWPPHAHLCVSHLTYSGRIPPTSPRSGWNTGTTYLQVLQYGVGKGILCAYSKEIDVTLFSPGRPNAHLCVSHLTYSGRIPPVSPRSGWNTGTITFQVLWYGAEKGILCAYSKE